MVGTRSTPCAFGGGRWVRVALSGLRPARSRRYNLAMETTYLTETSSTCRKCSREIGRDENVLGGVVGNAYGVTCTDCLDEAERLRREIAVMITPIFPLPG